MTTEAIVLASVCRGERYPKHIAADTGLTLRSVQQAVSRLQRKGALERFGFGVRQVKRDGEEVPS